MLLSYIPDILETGKEIQSIHDLYQIMVDAWLEREQPKVAKEALYSFSKKLALDLYLGREKRGMEALP